MDGYDTQEWKGREQFKCDACPFTSFREEEMQRHVFYHRGGANKVGGDVDETAAKSPRARRQTPTEPASSLGGDNE